MWGWGKLYWLGSFWPHPKLRPHWESPEPLRPVLSSGPLSSGIRALDQAYLQVAVPYSFISCCWFSFVSVNNHEEELWVFFQPLIPQHYNEPPSSSMGCSPRKQAAGGCCFRCGEEFPLSSGDFKRSLCSWIGMNWCWTSQLLRCHLLSTYWIRRMGKSTV